MDKDSSSPSGDINTGENNKIEESEEPDSNSNIEVEIIADERSEEYKEEVTGMKIKYSLTENEVKEYVKFSKKHDKYQKVQKRYVFLHLVLLVVLLSVSVITGSAYYSFAGLFPVTSIICMYLVPYMNNNITVNRMLREKEFTVEVFPDRIEVQTKSGIREIFLNNVCESTEHNNMVIIFSPEGHGLIIPLRAIEPELRADVQAIIAAGSTPRYTQYEPINL